MSRRLSTVMKLRTKKGVCMKKTREVEVEAGSRVSFEVFAEPGSKVFVAGTFNNWNPKKNPLKDNPDSGHYKAALILQRGAHEYKFVVNGVWSMDPNSVDWIPNSLGSINSVVYV